MTTHATSQGHGLDKKDHGLDKKDVQVSNLPQSLLASYYKGTVKPFSNATSSSQ